MSVSAQILCQFFDRQLFVFAQLDFLLCELKWVGANNDHVSAIFVSFLLILGINDFHLAVFSVFGLFGDRLSVLSILSQLPEGLSLIFFPHKLKLLHVLVGQLVNLPLEARDSIANVSQLI